MLLQVRASAVYALGTFINSVQERSEHANKIDQSIAITLLTIVSKDMSPLVRKVRAHQLSSNALINYIMGSIFIKYFCYLLNIQYIF